MNNPITGLPGVGTARVSTPREITAGNAQFAQFVPGLRTIDGSRSRDPLNSPDVDVLRAGMLLGKTSTNKYAPSLIGVLTVAAAAAATSLTVTLATATEIVRRIGTTGTFKLTAPPAAAGTVATQVVTFSAVNISTGVITCTAIAAQQAGNTGSRTVRVSWAFNSVAGRASVNARVDSRTRRQAFEGDRARNMADMQTPENVYGCTRRQLRHGTRWGWGRLGA